MAVPAGARAPQLAIEPATTTAALTAAAEEASRHAGPRQRMDAAAERRDAGRELRRRAARGSHARWEPPADRPDPVDLLTAANQGRMPELVPIRVGRMAASPFAFLRGSAAQMAIDLAGSPMTGLTGWICGDAHLSNFGLFASPEQDLVCDLNDFDESIVGPWEWDVKRMSASIVVAGRERGFADADCREAVGAAIGSYRRRLSEMASSKLIELHRARWHEGDLANALSRRSKQALRIETGKATTRTNDRVLARLTVERENGGWHFDESPPLLVRLGGEHTDRVLGALERYIATLRSDLRRLVRGYGLRDAALTVVGVGSVGTRGMVAMMTGNGDSDALFLQIKEAPGSQLRPQLASQPRRHEGRRVVEAQRAMQGLSDPFLGWTAIEGRDYYVRELKDMNGSVDVNELQRPRELRDCAVLVGGTLGMAHARCFDAATLTAYLGSGPRFSAAVAEFAVRYADQTERDHGALVDAIKHGRVEAELGV
ncbi:MAG: DUF2252 domain-containing protein [Thermoleophilaceae bacterium]